MDVEKRLAELNIIVRRQKTNFLGLDLCGKHKAHKLEELKERLSGEDETLYVGKHKMGKNEQMRLAGWAQLYLSRNRLAEHLGIPTATVRQDESRDECD